MSSHSRILHDGDDLVIARRLCAGDKEALNALLDRYYRPLVNFVVRYVDTVDLAEDIVQDLFIRLWDRRTSWRLSGTVQGYLYTAARNASLNALTSRSARTRAEYTAAFEAKDRFDKGEVTVIDSVEIEELRQAIALAIESLPERCREVFVLSRDHGLSYMEIAETLGVAQSTVRNQLARALRLLKQALLPFLTGVFVGFNHL